MPTVTSWNSLDLEELPQLFLPTYGLCWLQALREAPGREGLLPLLQVFPRSPRGLGRRASPHGSF